jgi:hypothetical protein
MFTTATFALSFDSALAASSATKKEPAFGCSVTLKKFRNEKNKKKYAAFAKGKAFTITGMMGCGYSWGQKSQAEADALALSNCRKRARNPEKCFISDRW